MNPKIVLIIETDKFIIPHFQAMGAFCTGCQPHILEGDTWLGQSQDLLEIHAIEFLETEDRPIQKVESLILENVFTPFLPIPSTSKCSDGYGNFLDISLPDSEKRGLRNKTLEKLYGKRIRIIKRIKPKHWKNQVARQVEYKKILQSKKFVSLPAFTNLGICFSDYPLPSDEDTIISRARIYGEENGLKIGKMYFKDLNKNSDFELDNLPFIP